MTWTPRLLMAPTFRTCILPGWAACTLSQLAGPAVMPTCERQQMATPADSPSFSVTRHAFSEQFHFTSLADCSTCSMASSRTLASWAITMSAAVISKYFRAPDQAFGLMVSMAHSPAAMWSLFFADSDPSSGQIGCSGSSSQLPPLAVAPSAFLIALRGG